MPPSVKQPAPNKNNKIKGAIEIIEEAVQLLRRLPLGVLSLYYIGSLPFVLGLLYFWADMSRSAFAHRYDAAASLGLALLFIWMKYWQAVFTQRLTFAISRGPAAAPSIIRTPRMILYQALIHSTGLFVLPVALIMVAPFSWAYAFYQNVSVFGDGNDDRVRDLARRSMKQAGLWPMQNHLIILIMFFFGFFVFLNLASAVMMIPQLIKSLLGIDTMFTRSGLHILNTTFLISVSAMTYLCLDPILKACYALRCFYGDSIRTGLDLKVELAGFLGAAKTGIGVLIILTFFLTAGAPAASGKIAQPKPAVSHVELDQSIKQTINQREFSWRMPREKSRLEEKEPGLLSEFMEWTVNQIKSGVRAVRRWMNRVDDWWRSLFPESDDAQDRPRDSTSWMSSAHIVLFIVLGLATCILGVFAWRIWKNRKNRPVVQAQAAPPTVPDLNDESVGADDLPVDKWLSLARELMEKGQTRLALRALYLATLAGLADHEIIVIAKHKSNRDYLREFRRRLQGNDDINDEFRRSVRIFDMAWYGRLEPTLNDIKDFAGARERIINAVRAEFGKPGQGPPVLN